jgi:hypothetical protein
MRFATLALIALTQQLPAITIKIDYTYDTSNFFNTQAKKSAIEMVAKFYGDLIKDKLLRIDASEFPGSSWTANPIHPVTGGTLSIANLVVPEDTIIVYVGARSLSGSPLGIGGPGGWGASGSQLWIDRIEGRGSAGAFATIPTDYSPWGGSITFDADSTWNFSLTQNQAGFEFISVALHEIGHVLGIGTADSWKNKISGGVFSGAAATRSNGTAPPVQSGGGHFGGSSLVSDVFGSFGRTHGVSRPVLMLASSTDNGTNFDVASDLDLAALIDCGWEISPPLDLTATTLKPSAAAFTWKSSSFLDYKVERGSNLQSFPGGSGSVAGNGTIQVWTDPAAPVSNTFYRLRATKAVGSAASAAPAAPAAAASSLNSFITTSSPPRIATGCYEGSH